MAFDTRTNRGFANGVFPCTAVLDAPTADSLGSGALCQWTDADLLTAKFGETATRTALPFQSVAVRDTTVGRAGLESLNSTGATQLLPPCGMGPADCTLEEPLLDVKERLEVDEAREEDAAVRAPAVVAAVTAVAAVAPRFPLPMPPARMFFLRC